MNPIRAEGPEQTSALADRIHTEGWAVTGPLVPPARLDELIAALEGIPAERSRGGVRNLLDIREVRMLARSRPVRAVAEAVLGPDCFAVRGILFDKTPKANWKAIWHQDLTIAVEQRREVPGYGPWSEKGGVPHVQPPASVLERMLAVRVHLDRCDITNGPVRVLPRSHRLGRLSRDEIAARKGDIQPVDCVVERGGILVFHPLVLHASSSATAPERRRVVHLEFASGWLGGELQWRDKV